MITVEHIAGFLQRLAPPRLAEDWDNVGLLIGDRQKQVQRIMICLTAVPATVAEAIQRKADLIVSHHPLPLKPLRRITAETPTGRLLLELIAARVALYSMHTAFDSARDGINQRIAAGLNLRGITPLRPHPEGLGAGRFGWLEEAITLSDMVQRVKTLLSVEHVQFVGPAQQAVRTVGVACGAADDFVEIARDAGCDCLIVGEARYHTALEAEAAGMGLILAGHFASERFGVRLLAATLAKQFPQLEIWAAQNERDPIRLG
jgi:dinuclear metal center YbgI/SA1388 family protein